MVDELPDCASGTAKQKTRKTHRQLAYFDFDRSETTPRFRNCFFEKLPLIDHSTRPTFLSLVHALASLLADSAEKTFDLSACGILI